MATLKELADVVQGAVVGDSNMDIAGVSTVQEGKPGTITFVAHPKYFKYAESTKASAVIASSNEMLGGKDGIIVDKPQLAIAKVLEYYSPQYPKQKGVHKTALVDPSAKIGDGVSIGPNTIIESGVTIGENAILGANNIIHSDSVIGVDSEIKHNTTFYHRTIIGDRCLIHSGAVIGSDGYGFVSDKDIHFKIPQNGKVVIGNDVEIGANCTIDRGTIGDTIIEDMCKFDNGVQIAHNVTIGKGCLLTAHVTIAGSSKIGEFCIFGGQAGAIDHVTIGDRAIFACYTAVMKDLPGGKIYSGAPAREIKEKNRRDAVHVEVKQLKNRLKKIEEKLEVAL
ncbi:MAG: UDP-3-O-(3-hydroxymyristoyl)glucosamine N-acyltransferase [Candidatus Marinimicrobia bacterium]|nr:UDP-3-O-(3-hydroxymyristoyl)glucosamine N-acyltransferase [Candidatus Neomarinimicrobiota bacterium]MBT3675179.1 UDP-3-O-(3-hydroxymyristoyl)glucosamine N-acyltransferase [Candidatus Neomarinimicrobiota bacterium]MBT3763889.1 UDP-3-O-(3-hydroxymyristoyl)glucosamine N-acyltransferase [Candidatus Neomarinimicrobiota bacterium]MBT4068018.1 UDP-3-O-(3-hydroxymyristoyl)glucosamine N-acyltransferase [Candidatus Neomarinimicrobiota bacterium]MBT4271251.1 UDP-3-O-(3-hydroxymyristoyl)glucosamine N-ac